MTTTNYGGRLLDQHQAMLAASGISPEQAEARGYRSVDTKRNLEHYEIAQAGRRVPGLLVPMLRVDGSQWGFQYRPDDPRELSGRTVKYETPPRQTNGIDFPPGVRPMLADLETPLWITEGVKKADSAVERGLACVALSGVWSWKGKPGRTKYESTIALPDFDDVGLKGRGVVLAFDSDIMTKPDVRNALERLAEYLTMRGVAQVRYLLLPDDGDGKTGLDDFLAVHDVADLGPHVLKVLPPPEDEPAKAEAKAPPRREPMPPVTLPDALATFRRWLHLPDVDPLLAVAAAAVGNRTRDASPLWLLMIGPPSAGKTEQIIGLSSLPESVTAATVTEASLLSGTSAREKAADATGGLLRQVGDHGLIVMKDFTSVLSQNGDARAAALGALREVYDGAWSRPVGTDGGKLLTWAGKLGVVAGCTNAYDKHYSVISQLGDRFLIVRLAEDDADPDAQALSIGLAALSHGDGERQMRDDLTRALAGLVEGADLDRTHRPLSRDEQHEIVRLARYAGVSRTPVDRNRYTGDLEAVPAPEGPGRLTIAYRQMLGGLEAIGADPETCWRVLSRLALDTAPAIRADVITALVADRAPRRTSEVAQAAGLVTKTASRVLDDLALIGLAEHTKASGANNAPDMWAPSGLLLRLWPKNESRTQIDPPHPTPHQGEGDNGTHTHGAYTGGRQPVSYIPEPSEPPECCPPGELPCLDHYMEAKQ